jgi:iron complex outermembrane receptor protein
MLCSAFLLPLLSPCAQDSIPPPPASPFVLKQSVTVTATRGELPTDQAPVSLSIVTSRQMASRRIQLLDQALNTAPGLFAFRGKGVQDTNAGIGMRGFAGRGSGQARFLVLAGGQPLNDSYTGQVHWTLFPIEEVDRVEIVRGGFSSLYGGNAMGGVINILTKPVTRRQAELYGQLGSQSTVRYGARVAGRFRQRLGLSLAYDRLQSGGYPTQRSESGRRRLRLQPPLRGGPLARSPLAPPDPAWRSRP